MPVIRTSLGIAYSVLITGINSIGYMPTVFQENVLITGIESSYNRYKFSGVAYYNLPNEFLYLLSNGTHSLLGLHLSDVS